MERLTLAFRLRRHHNSFCMEGSVAQQSGSTLLRHLLTWRGATAGVAFIALSAILTGLLGEQWAPLAIILAEIGAVLVAVFVIHFTYEHYVRAGHLNDIKAARDQSGEERRGAEAAAQRP